VIWEKSEYWRIAPWRVKIALQVGVSAPVRSSRNTCFVGEWISLRIHEQKCFGSFFETIAARSRFLPLSGKRARTMVKILTLLAAIAALPVSALAVDADSSEQPKNIIADQIRRQGIPCTDPVSAERDVKLTRPNEAAWTLKCKEGTYRVILIPDMAAKVERLD